MVPNQCSRNKNFVRARCCTVQLYTVETGALRVVRHFSPTKWEKLSLYYFAVSTLRSTFIMIGVFTMERGIVKYMHVVRSFQESTLCYE